MEEGVAHGKELGKTGIAKGKEYGSKAINAAKPHMDKAVSMDSTVKEEFKKGKNMQKKRLSL